MASFSRRLLRGSIPAAVVGTTLYVTSQPLLADEGAPSPAGTVRCGRAPSGDKLPIYPTADADRPVTLIEAPHPLTPYIAQARETTTDALSGAGKYVEAGVSKWIGFERKVEKEVKSVVAQDEPLTPGIIYVLIAGLTGSVITRNRSFPLRWLAPPLFTVAAAPYFLPKTSHNIRAYLSDLEDKHFPELAARQDRFLSTASSHLEMTLDRLRGAEEGARVWGAKAVEGVENATGLRVADAVRKGQDKVEKEKAKLQGIAEQKLETVGYVVEQRPVAEIVRPAEENKASTPAKRLV